MSAFMLSVKCNQSFMRFPCCKRMKVSLGLFTEQGQIHFEIYIQMQIETSAH